MKTEYSIRLSGLKDDTHVFNFEVGDDFFETIEFGEIRKGNLQVKVEMIKEASMVVLNFTISGKVNIMCDRCSDMYDQEIEGDNQLIVKFGDASLQNTDDILVVAYDESEIPIATYIYEFTHLLLPQRRVHPDDGCNQEVVDKLEEMHNGRRFEGGDPRWDALKEVL